MIPTTWISFLRTLREGWNGTITKIACTNNCPERSGTRHKSFLTLVIIANPFRFFVVFFPLCTNESCIELIYGPFIGCARWPFCFIFYFWQSSGIGICITALRRVTKGVVFGDNNDGPCRRAFDDELLRLFSLWLNPGLQVEWL